MVQLAGSSAYVALACSNQDSFRATFVASPYDVPDVAQRSAADWSIRHSVLYVASARHFPPGTMLIMVR